MTQPPIKIVIIDDVLMVRESYRMLLDQDERFSVIAEGVSGAEAIDIASKLKPHVILMDINMSPVNGFEATRKIVKKHSDIKIIGLSIHNQPGYARNMLQLGAKGFVTKNSDQQELIEAILEVYKGKTFLCKEVREKMESEPE